MHFPHRQLPGLAALALVGAALLGALLIQRETRIASPSADLWGIEDSESKTDLDGVRKRLYELRERHRQILALNLAGRRQSQASNLQGLQKWISDTASQLGQTLRPDPEVDFQPEAFFASYWTGNCRMRLLEWSVKGASAAYSFEISYPHRDIPDEIVRDVREREVVGNLQLLASSSPTRSGKRYTEVYRVTPRGKEKTRLVKLPPFRIIQLTFQRVNGERESLVLEDAYSESDRLKAGQSGISFKRSVEWEIPMGTIALRDSQEGDMRSVTAKKGSKFLFANTEYVVLDICPDAIEVAPVSSGGKVEKWARREPPPEPF